MTPLLVRIQTSPKSKWHCKGDANTLLSVKKLNKNFRKRAKWGIARLLARQFFGLESSRLSNKCSRYGTAGSETECEKQPAQLCGAGCTIEEISEKDDIFTRHQKLLHCFSFTLLFPVVKFLVLDWRDIVDSGIGLPAGLHRLAGRYYNAMPESTISPPARD
jgi:hypothetical protein